MSVQEADSRHTGDPELATAETSTALDETMRTHSEDLPAFVEADMVCARGRLLHFLSDAGSAASTAPDAPGHPSSARSLDS